MSAAIPASRFKAQCLELLDRVAERHETIVITKRGRRVARLVPIDTPAQRRPLVGCMTVAEPDDDLLSTGARWDASLGKWQP